jgi:hypothetical protein
MDGEGKPRLRRLADVIAEVMKSAAMPRKGEPTQLREAWERAAGMDVAKRSRPLGLRNGELTVSFESPALRQEVEAFRKGEILSRLRTEFPGRRIAALRCVLG